jgi:hypothetical protein
MRWPVAGPFQTFHLGGGPGGLADFMVHGGPVGDPGPGAPGCRHDQAPHDPGRALRQNGGGVGNPSRSGADPPDASPGRTRDRRTAGVPAQRTLRPSPSWSAGCWSARWMPGCRPAG